MSIGNFWKFLKINPPYGWRLSGLGPEIREENHQISDNYQKNFRKLNWFSEKMFGRQNPGGDIPPWRKLNYLIQRVPEGAGNNFRSIKMQYLEYNWRLSLFSEFKNSVKRFFLHDCQLIALGKHSFLMARVRFRHTGRSFSLAFVGLKKLP